MGPIIHDFGEWRLEKFLHYLKISWSLRKTIGRRKRTERKKEEENEEEEEHEQEEQEEEERSI